MKRITMTILILAMAAVTAVASPPQGGMGMGGPPPQNGQGPGSGPRGGGELAPAMLAQFLGLTEAQIAQVQALRETLRSTVEPLVETQKANREQLQAAVAAGDAAKAGALAVANYQIGQQIKAARDTFRTGFEALLTAEQKAKFAVYQELMELRRGHRRGPRG
jgi:Spy/CpxP family protein refolding chaperone